MLNAGNLERMNFGFENPLNTANFKTNFMKILVKPRELIWVKKQEDGLEHVVTAHFRS